MAFKRLSQFYLGTYPHPGVGAVDSVRWWRMHGHTKCREIYWDLILISETYNDVIKWDTFSALLAICAGHWSPVNSPHKGQWRGVLMFSLLCAWTKGWVNNGDWWFETPSRPLWRHCNAIRSHYCVCRRHGTWRCKLVKFYVSSFKIFYALMISYGISRHTSSVYNILVISAPLHKSRIDSLFTEIFDKYLKNKKNMMQLSNNIIHISVKLHCTDCQRKH